MPANPPLSSNQPPVQDQLLERTCSSSNPSPGLTKDHFISTDANSRQHVDVFRNKQLLSKVTFDFLLFLVSVHQGRVKVSRLKNIKYKYVKERYVLSLLKTIKPFLRFQLRYVKIPL